MTKLGIENPDGSVEEQMEWEEWFNKYQPVMINATQDDGELMEFDTCQEAADYIKEHMPCVPEYQRCKHVWTTTAGDGWHYTSTGYHVVDRMHCYVCLVPWVKEYEACMYEDHGTWCDYCDDYVKECSHDGEDAKCNTCISEYDDDEPCDVCGCEESGCHEMGCLSEDWEDNL